MTVNEEEEEEAEEEEMEDKCQEELQEDDLSSWSAADRSNLCIAARNHVENATISVDKSIDRAEIFEFEFTKNKVEKHFGIACPTNPVMYLRLNKNKNVISVVLIKTDPMDVSIAKESVARSSKKVYSSNRELPSGSKRRPTIDAVIKSQRTS